MKKTGIALCLAAALTLSGCGGNPNNSDSSTRPEGPVELYQLAPSSKPLMQSYVIKTKHNKLNPKEG